MMRPNEIRVLFTCCTWHAKDLIQSLVNNPDGVVVRAYAANAYEPDLPVNCCEGVFVLPPISDPEYGDVLLSVCVNAGIDVIMPMSSLELALMSNLKEWFQRCGVEIAVNRWDVLNIANDKVEFAKHFGQFMPKQATDFISIGDFLSACDGRVCVKINGACGGKGFAVVDNSLVNEPTMFHAYGRKHYISTTQFYEILKEHNGVIAQEYIDGVDYSVSMLCNYGTPQYIVGYYGYEMEFGAIMRGEIKRNYKAFDIACKVASKLGLQGLVSFDFIVKDDDVYLLECNPRISASLAFVAHAGCNMVYYECLRLLGCELPAESSLEIVEGLKMKKYFGSEYYV